MKCPACNHKDTKVLDSRMVSGGLAVRRRRECLKCSFRFSTYEEVEILDLIIIKRDGSKVQYSREKLESGLRKALEKRPITHEEFKKLVNNIERDVQLKRKRELKSSEIGEIVMKWLKKLDEVAYIRFASVYRSFKDVKTFYRELDKLSKGGGKRRQSPARKSKVKSPKSRV